MKNIKEKIEESKLPKLRQLKNIPEWCMSYPDFCDNIEKLWDDENNRGLIATMLYFMTGNEDAEDYGWQMVKETIKNLYHK